MKEQEKPTREKNKTSAMVSKETPYPATGDPLRESEQRIRTFLDSTSDMIFLKDESFRHIVVNSVLCKIYGKKESEIIGKTDFDLMDEQAAMVCRKTDEQALRATNVLISEEVVRGRYYETRKFPVDLAEGKKGIGAYIRDITERKRMEEDLREKEVQYRNLADTGLALIWAAGTDKLCNYFNQPWLKFTGRTLEQEMGNGWTEGVHPDDLDRCVQIYVTAFDKREAFDMEYRLRHVSGEYRWIRDLGTPNYDGSGEFIGYIGHCFDINSQKHAEEEIRELNENLEQRIKERTAELTKTIDLLEETNRAFVGRELRIIELKEQIAELEGKITAMKERLQR